MSGALGRRAVAEALGTFALVFAGCGAVVSDAVANGAIGVVGIGLAFFFVLLAAIAALGHVSGAHFNPAVSLAFFLARSVTTDTRVVGAPAALAIAAAVGLAAIVFGPVIGASLNPARSFGPALAAGQWQDFWLYVAGPMLGAPLGALAYQYVRGEAQDAAPQTAITEEERDGDRAVRLPA